MPAAPLYDDYLYARISEDENLTEKGVLRQLKDCRLKSAASGGRIIGEYYDNDVSALRMAPRPEFDKLMAAITAPNPERRQRRIICAHTSRIWRNRLERAQGITVLGASKVIITPVNGPQLDLTTAAGRMLAGILGESDTGESETKGERVVDAARERANEGRANGAVAYGWKRIYQYDARGKPISFEDVVHEQEAAVVRQIVADLLSGKSLSQVTRDLNQRGVPAPMAGIRRKNRAIDQDEGGTRWGRSSIKKIATRPANIGLRVYHRGRDTEQLLPAAWPPIIDVADHRKVVALLTAAPGRPVQRGGSRMHLLTWGIGFCSVCGSHLETGWKGNKRWNQRVRMLVCAEKGCVARTMARVDELVDEVMIGLLSRPDAVELLEGNSQVASDALIRAVELRKRLNAAADSFAAGVIDEEQLRVITSRLKPEVAAAEEVAKASETSPHAAAAIAVVGSQARQRWHQQDVNQKRAIMKAFGVKVYIDPRPRRGGPFDPLTVRVVPPERLQAPSREAQLPPVARIDGR